MPGYKQGAGIRGRKTVVRIAPYLVKPYAFDEKLSVPGTQATQIMITGFDPFTPESRLRTVFSQWGTVAEVRNQTDPGTGSFLGICLINYRDTLNSKKTEIRATAIQSAKNAEQFGNGAKIGTSIVKVTLDKTGRKAKKLVDVAVKRIQEERSKLRVPEPHPPPTLIPVDPIIGVPGAPKGPSGKKAPEGPRVAALPKPASHLVVETDPIINTIKRQPYIFIAQCYVPVLGTTLPHIKKRLKNYYWNDIRLDKSGYFIIFEDSRDGENEAGRCFKECHMAALFTYVMNMDIHKEGNPNYVRSPSPERVRAEKRQREEMERYQREEEEDLQLELKERAENLDPVRAAIDALREELREKVLNDMKTKIAAPFLFEYLDPAKHVEKRRRLGIADPQSTDNKPTTLFARGDESPLVGTPASRQSGFAGRGRKPLGTYDANMQPKSRRLPKNVNAFMDERRKQPPKRPVVVRGLHRQMQGFWGDDEEDSEDEHRSVATRETEEQESRPISREASIETEIFPEPSTRLSRAKRRRLEAHWGEDGEDDSIDDATARRLLAHLIDKDVEKMAERELEQVLSVLPRSSSLWKQAEKVRKRNLQFRRHQEKYDEIFGPVDVPPDTTVEGDLSADKAAETVEGHEGEEVVLEVAEKVVKPKRGRKPKKKQVPEEEEQILEEATKVEDITDIPEEIDMRDVEDETPKEGTPFEGVVDYTFSTGKEPRRTVEDDPEILMDIDGWQHLIKDDEDLNLLRKALAVEPSSDLGDVHLWAMKQKEIKSLNNGGVTGVVRSAAKISGYYVPNPSGCARTEPTKKIRNEEKSKYLPHRIKVLKQREEREAQAKNDPAAAAAAAKLKQEAKLTSMASSRQNRANNRRLANEISTQNLSIEGDTMKFNQLKKRKKLVRFDRSAIHNWGLYAEENIAQTDMIIEYVGEKVRQRVADLREAKYTIQGVGSSYLFRIDEDTIIDATKQGGIARFINHSCSPNCTAKIIRVDGEKRIVIYALRDIAKNEELTYDYKFERELGSDDRIPCLCGSVGCKGFLN
ncbi:hypothetical protein EJ05DRAFT_340819 [Pseudovirgaria hyperparasitica]|uniref:Histone-lysine N-methyltransferase, H3 lysine-4 specific n=1 Tax=Pseudovirgaria hyperparasitica TaxID=470096 RepID=A0A6A6WCJ0_9PEZI|nr:uncharacterized protein EJ05DRAFT_340819 [Pseudovirgaria hyperparasitica]KAF2759287.1 hypothetical protein EJ05DRAFT_340819 [Pseudovirgaria hyperparasitica]